MERIEGEDGEGRESGEDKESGYSEREGTDSNQIKAQGSGSSDGGQFSESNRPRVREKPERHLCRARVAEQVGRERDLSRREERRVACGMA